MSDSLLAVCFLPILISHEIDFTRMTLTFTYHASSNFCSDSYDFLSSAQKLLTLDPETGGDVGMSDRLGRFCYLV